MTNQSNTIFNVKLLQKQYFEYYQFMLIIHRKFPENSCLLFCFSYQIKFKIVHFLKLPKLNYFFFSTYSYFPKMLFLPVTVHNIFYRFKILLLYYIFYAFLNNIFVQLEDSKSYYKAKEEQNFLQNTVN